MVGISFDDAEILKAVVLRYTLNERKGTYQIAFADVLLYLPCVVGSECSIWSGFKTPKQALYRFA